jgi:hypothetical protein
MNKDKKLYILYRNLSPEQEQSSDFTLEVVYLFSLNGEVNGRTFLERQDLKFANLDEMQEEMVKLASKRGQTSIVFLNVFDFNLGLENLQEPSQVIEIFEERGEELPLTADESKGKGLLSRIFD